MCNCLHLFCLFRVQVCDIHFNGTFTLVLSVCKCVTFTLMVHLLFVLSNVDYLIGLTPIELCPCGLEPIDSLPLSLSRVMVDCHCEV